MAATLPSHEDNPKKSSIPIVSPCIICGQIVEVKTEIDFDDFGDLLPTNDLRRTHGHLSFEKDGNTDQLLQFFFKVFRVQPEEEWRMWRWNESGEDEKKSPFCHLCQQRLEVLQEVEKKLEELKVQLENGREELKDAMERSEEFLGRIGIYKRDNVYVRIRKQVLGSINKAVHNENTDLDSFENVGEECKTRRTSSRGAAKKAKEKLSYYALSTKSDPFVLLSSADMEIAEGKGMNYVVENEWRTEECDNSPCSIQDQNDSEVDMETCSKMSSDPDYLTGALGRQSKNRIKMKVKKSKRKPDKSRTKNFKSNDKPNPIAECDLSSLSKVPVFLPVGEDGNQKSKRKSIRTKPKEKDDMDFIPAEENKSSSDSGEDLDSDNDESKEGKQKYVPFRHYKCDVDEATGTYSVENMTLIKIPNNEFGQLQYECSKCSKVITIRKRSKRNVKDHLRNHFWRSHSGRHKCKECGKELRSSTALSQHVESIHQNRLFPCPICGKPFAYANGLKNHKLTHLSAEERQQSGKHTEARFRFQCEDCGFRSKTQKNLKAHQMRHRTEEEKAKAKKVSLCPECGKYILICNLKKHMNVVHASTNIRSYPCLLCEKRFKTAKGLKGHKNSMVHRKEGPFKCTMCPKSFVKKYALDEHVNNHLNIRPFKCEHCPSAFVRRSHLKNHCSIYHDEGSNPKRPTFVRGLPKKCLINTTEPVHETCVNSSAGEKAS